MNIETNHVGPANILGEIRPAGGFDTLAELRWEDQIVPSILVQKSNRPWDRTAALFVATEIGWNIRRLRGVEGMANW